MTGELSSSSILICRTCTLACRLSLGGSMVGVSRRSSEGCGFDPRPGLGNRFSEVRAWRTFIHHLRKTCYKDIHRSLFLRSTVANLVQLVKLL